MPSIPKPTRRPKVCKTHGCETKRYANLGICYRHYVEREKEKRLAADKKRRDRRVNSKKYLDHQRKSVKNELDKVFSKLIRAVGHCVRCGKQPPEVVLNCSHIYSRGNLAVRWDELNAKSLCVGCHWWWGANPAEARDWLISSGVRTEEQMSELRRRANLVKQWTVLEMKSLLAELQAKLPPPQAASRLL